MHRGGTRETIPIMTNPETIERVRELRQRGRTPKEIARALGLPPAAVAPLIRVVAATQPAIQGPHDDAARVIRTLRRSVGDDNFHYLCEIA
jgi:hypothetical protein